MIPNACHLSQVKNGLPGFNRDRNTLTQIVLTDAEKPLHDLDDAQPATPLRVEHEDATPANRSPPP